MAAIEIWLQLEVLPEWDPSPNPDRMTGKPYDEPRRIQKNLLVYRRYKRDWSRPIDQRVNAWDINEPDPAGGTIPGPTLSCDVGDSLVVHFRNCDRRFECNEQLSAADCAHSVHTHGIAFEARYDGAYPLSPLDLDQPIDGGELEAWAAIGLEQFRTPNGVFKRGDRVPPGGTFVYRWDTLGWATTAGVWMYHDHSIHDVMNVRRGAVGFLVVHAPGDGNEVNDEVPQASPLIDEESRILVVHPPHQALYLQLYHELVGDDPAAMVMAINGRVGLGNTPTLLAGPDTKMRFGLGTLGDGFHTFHIHGHRWLISGPHGVVGPAGHGAAVSPPTIAVSAFEDTRTLGPAETFSFTIRQGGPFGAHPSGRKGEWHMHCHVLRHMMMGRGERMRSGMMGSLLVAERGDKVLVDVLAGSHE